jgi:pancreatic triacylglycerol lipase
MVGNIGRMLKEMTSGKLVVPKIFALDPASQGFERSPRKDFGPIKENDGKYVHVIHSNTGMFGMEREVGTADFYPDGGDHHPGCDDDMLSNTW